MKIAEPEMTAVNFNDLFRDQMGKIDKGHIEVFPNLRPHDKTNSGITKIPRLVASFQKEETNDWGDYRKLLEEIRDFF